MRPGKLGLIVLLCLSVTGCALWRKDREEPVENGPRQETAGRARKPGDVLKPSDVLKPESARIASPINDYFYLRGTYFAPSVTTELRLDSTGGALEGALLNGEEDLGLDDQADQGRMEFAFRVARRHLFRIDYFKLNRFKEQPLPRDIRFGDFEFQQGDIFRSRLDWRMVTLTHTYSVLYFDRVEAGIGLGLSLLEAHAEGRERGTNNREEASEVAPVPTLAVMAAWQISKRFSLNVRGQMLSASRDDFSGELSDFHGDVQFRPWPNLAFGLGYTKIAAHIEVLDADLPLLFDMDASGPELFVRVSF